MINKTITITQAELDTNAVVEKNVYLDITESTVINNEKTYRYYPNIIQLINQTGQTIKYNFISNDSEYTKYTKDATNYALITLHNNEKYIWRRTEVLPIVSKILVQMPTGSSSADFIVESIANMKREEV